MPQPALKHEAQPQSQPRQPSKPRSSFDIDNYLNPLIPRSPLYLLPTWISYWFGYRSPRKSAPSAPRHHRFQTLTLYASVLIGAFCGLAIIENAFLALPPLSGHQVPIVIASFGAAAILEYNTIESPLAQPRNLVVGHFFSALVAVCITKLFEHLPPDRFEELRWLAGALAVGVASMIMSITKTVHPPAGATALLAATNVEIQVLGWWLLPLSFLAALLMLASALVLNNLTGRRFPVYWWTPVDLTALREERRQATKEKEERDVEQASGSIAEPGFKMEETISDEDTEAGSHVDDLRKSSTQDNQLGHAVSYSAASRTPHIVSQSRSRSEAHKSQQEAGSKRETKDEERDRIIITKNKIIVPDWLELTDWEDEVLRILMERMRDG